MRSPCRRTVNIAASAIACLCIGVALSARAETPPLKGAALGEDAAFYLDVVVNGRAVGLILAFQRLGDGSFAIAPDELEAAGLKADPASRAEDGLVHIANLPGVAARYDGAAQRMHFDAAPGALLPYRVEARPQPAARPDAVRDMGAVLNYTLHAAGGRYDGWRFDGVSALLEGRAFGAFGMVTGSVLARSEGRGRRWRRLDTTWRWADPDGPTSYLAGDVISGALAWTSPVRLGGVQVRRNFALRPDMVTQPLADLRGSADVPSTVEVYVDGARQVSAEVPAGPFEVANVPLVTGAGTARIVVRDALGREQVSETPFFATTSLLAEGLFDFSAEIGVARRDFGGVTDSYDNRLFASGSLRYGYSDALTLEAHAEGGGGLIMGGVGLVTELGSMGALSLAAAASRHGDVSGTRVQAALELDFEDVRVFALSQRNSSGFADIARVSALEGAAVPVRALDQAAVSFPGIWRDGSLTLSYARLDRADFGNSEIGAAHMMLSLPGEAMIYASAFVDFADERRYGVFAGLSVPLGEGSTASASIDTDGRRTEIAAEYARAEQAEPGGYGWRVRVSEETQAARASYRADFARLEGSLWRMGDTAQATLQADGALVLADGGLFASQRIDDAFAVVDAGAAGVPVTLENRPVGATDSDGQLLVTGLRAYEPNRIAIDPSKLPVAATFGVTVREVAPHERGGAVVDFGVESAPAAALVTLRRADGRHVPAGALAILEATGAQFTVGYEGQVYVTGLGAENRLAVTAPGGEGCAADFAFRRDGAAQARVDNVICTGSGA